MNFVLGFLILFISSNAFATYGRPASAEVGGVPRNASQKQAAAIARAIEFAEAKSKGQCDYESHTLHRSGYIYDVKVYCNRDRTRRTISVDSTWTRFDDYGWAYLGTNAVARCTAAEDDADDFCDE